MNWIDQGFLVSKNRYSENSVIVELYTKQLKECESKLNKKDFFGIF